MYELKFLFRLSKKGKADRRCEILERGVQRRLGIRVKCQAASGIGGWGVGCKSDYTVSVLSSSLSPLPISFSPSSPSSSCLHPSTPRLRIQSAWHITLLPSSLCQTARRAHQHGSHPLCCTATTEEAEGQRLAYMSALPYHFFLTWTCSHSVFHFFLLILVPRRHRRWQMKAMFPYSHLGALNILYIFFILPLKHRGE